MNFRKYVFATIYLMCCSALAEQTTVLLRYELYNQITTNELIVLSSGKVLKSTSQFGRWTTADDEQLTDEATQNLIQNIKDAGPTWPLVEKEVEEALGSLSGQLVVQDHEGSRKTIRSVERNGSGEDTTAKALCIPNEAALEIVKFVNKRVKNKIFEDCP